MITRWQKYLGQFVEFIILLPSSRPRGVSTFLFSDGENPIIQLYIRLSWSLPFRFWFFCILLYMCHKQPIMIFILSNLNKICVSSHPNSCSTIFTSFTSCYAIFFSFMSSRAQSVDFLPLPLNCFCLFCFRIFAIHNDGQHIETCQTWREACLLNFGDFLVLTSIPVKNMFCIK